MTIVKLAAVDYIELIKTEFAKKKKTNPSLTLLAFISSLQAEMLELHDLATSGAAYVTPSPIFESIIENIGVESLEDPDQKDTVSEDIKYLFDSAKNKILSGAGISKAPAPSQVVAPTPKPAPAPAPTPAPPTSVPSQALNLKNEAVKIISQGDEEGISRAMNEFFDKNPDTSLEELYEALSEELRNKKADSLLSSDDADNQLGEMDATEDENDLIEYIAKFLQYYKPRFKSLNESDRRAIISAAFEDGELDNETLANFVREGFVSDDQLISLIKDNKIDKTILDYFFMEEGKRPGEGLISIKVIKYLFENSKIDEDSFTDIYSDGAIIKDSDIFELYRGGYISFGSLDFLNEEGVLDDSAFNPVKIYDELRELGPQDRLERIKKIKSSLKLKNEEFGSFFELLSYSHAESVIKNINSKLEEEDQINLSEKDRIIRNFIQNIRQGKKIDQSIAMLLDFEFGIEREEAPAPEPEPRPALKTTVEVEASTAVTDVITPEVENLRQNSGVTTAPSVSAISAGFPVQNIYVTLSALNDDGTLKELTSSNYPVIDERLLVSLWNQTMKDIEELSGLILPVSRRRIGGRSSDLYVPLPEPEKIHVAKTLNDLIYKIKTLETYILNRIEQYKAELDRVTDQKLRTLHKQHISYIENKFDQQSIIKKIINNETIISSLFIISSATSFPQVFRYAYSLDANPNAAKQAIQNAIDCDLGESESLQISESILSSAMQEFKRKAVDFLQLRVNDQRSAFNFINNVIVSFRILARLVAGKIQGKVTQVKSTARTCPVCFKYVNSSFSSYSQSKDTSYFILNVSPIRRVKDGYAPIEGILYNQEALAERVFYINNDYLSKFEKSRVISTLAQDANLTPLKRKMLQEIEYIKNLISSENQGMTWKQIEAEMNGGFASQRSAWHRRSSALLEMGGEVLGQPSYIMDDRIGCPAAPLNGSESTSGGSYCGAKFKKVQYPESSPMRLSSPAMSYQPTFSGKWIKAPMSEQAKDIPIQNPILGDDGTTYSEEADKLRRPGFKFSSLSFGCPCLITDLNRDQKKYYTKMFISKAPGGAGSSDFVYPTKPDGRVCTSQDLPHGVRGFIACGAPTSISSFNREVGDGNTFILETMLSAFEGSKELYFQFINELIKNGFDVQELIYLNSDMLSYMEAIKSESINKESAFQELYQTSKDRIKKISGFIAEASNVSRSKTRKITKNTSVLEIFNKLFLVCPFGHKFSIEHSRKFGSSYYINDVVKVDDPNYFLYSGEVPKKDLSLKESDVAWTEDNPYAGYHMIRSTQSEIMGGSTSSTDQEGKVKEVGAISKSVSSTAKNAEEMLMQEDVPREFQIPGTFDEYETFFGGSLNLYLDPSFKPARITAFKRAISAKCNVTLETLKKLLLSLDAYTRGVIGRSEIIINSLKFGPVRIEDLGLETYMASISGEIIKEINQFSEEIGRVEYSFDPGFIDEMEGYIGNISKSIAGQLSKQLEDVYQSILDYISKPENANKADDIFRDLENYISDDIISSAIGNTINLLDEALREAEGFGVFTYGVGDEYEDEEGNEVELEESQAKNRIKSISEGLRNRLNNNEKTKSLKDKIKSKLKAILEQSEKSDILTERLYVISYAIRLSELVIDTLSERFDSSKPDQYMGFPIGTDFRNIKYNNLLSGNMIREIVSRMPRDYDDIYQKGKDNVFQKLPQGSYSYAARFDMLYNILKGLAASAESSCYDAAAINNAKNFLSNFIVDSAKTIASAPNIKAQANAVNKAVNIFTFIPVTGYSETIKTASYTLCPNETVVPKISKSYSDYSIFRAIPRFIVYPTGPTKKSEYMHTLLLRKPSPDGKSMLAPQRFVVSIENSLTDNEIQEAVNKKIEDMQSRGEDVGNLNVIKTQAIISALMKKAKEKKEEIEEPGGYLDKFVEAHNAVQGAVKISRGACRYEISRADYVLSQPKTQEISRVEVNEKTGKSKVLDEGIFPGLRFDDKGGKFTLQFSNLNLSSGAFSLIYDFADVPNFEDVFKNVLSNESIKKLKESNKLALILEPETIRSNIEKCNSYYITAYFGAGYFDTMIRKFKSLFPNQEAAAEVFGEYMNTVGLSPKHFKIRFDSGMGAEAISSNFDNRKLQLGKIKPADSNQTVFYSTTYGVKNIGGTPTVVNNWSHSETFGFSDKWAYVGFNLPIFHRDYSDSTRLNMATSVGISDFRTIIEFDGRPLDISPLMLRGRKDENSRDFEISRIEVLERELIGLINNLTGDNVQQDQKIKREIDNKVRELKSYQVRINSTPSMVPYLPGASGVSSQDFFSKIKSGGSVEEDQYGLTVQLVSPMHAFRIINNPEIMGIGLNAEERERLKDFVLRVYNINPIINYVRNLPPTAIPGYDVKNFDAGYLFNNEDDPTRSLIIKKINEFIKKSQWHSEVGEYFNIMIDLNNPSNTTYFNFNINSSDIGDGLNPSVKNLIAAGKRAKEELVKSKATTPVVEETVVTEQPEQLEQPKQEVSKNLLGRVRDRFNQYVFPKYEDEDEEEGEEENEASDGFENYLQDSHSNSLNNSMRVNRLRRMIGEARDRDAALSYLLDDLF